MNEFIISIMSFHLVYTETGERMKAKLPFVPEKGDYISINGKSSLYRVVGRCVAPDDSPITLFVYPDNHMRTHETLKEGQKRMEAASKK